MDKKLLVAAGIVTYNPVLSALEETLKSIKEQTDLVFVADNASENKAEVEKLCKDYGVHICSFKKNRGIAYALNAIMDAADTAGASHVITFDQDSEVPEDIVSELLRSTSEEDVACVCPMVFDRNAGEEVHAAFHETEGEIREVDQCITSGALTSVDAWKKIGGYDDCLFIDMVDFDFCIRLRKAGYRILKNTKVVMQHAIGETRVRHFLFFKVHVMNHSAMRKYYMTRNRIYVSYKHTGKMGARNLFGIIKAIILVIFYESDKKAKLKALFRGLRDGVRMRKRVLCKTKNK